MYDLSRSITSGLTGHWGLMEMTATVKLDLFLDASLTPL
jgi:hypothetical protein